MPKKTGLARIINETSESLLGFLWQTDPIFMKILTSSSSLKDARKRIFDYLNNTENELENVISDKFYENIHVLEIENAKECIRVLKNIFRTKNEQIAEFSALNLLYRIAVNEITDMKRVNPAFLTEMLFLIKGVNCMSEIYEEVYTKVQDPERKVRSRMHKLDVFASGMETAFKRFKTGQDEEIVSMRRQMKKRILKFYRAGEDDWNKYKWHLSNVITSPEQLVSLVKLSQEEFEGVETAVKNHIPFQITPYYLSLFNPDGRSEHDRTVRAQVLPTVYYCRKIAWSRVKEIDMDFMGEKFTSPVPGITRRYPNIVILKPYDSCPQICVYCQRNWEIKNIERAVFSKDQNEKAVKWIKENPQITEVLITGGDPLTLGNTYLNELLESLAKIEHLERIRIGTRTLVTIPFRINERFLEILKKYHEPGKREICVVTHVESPLELTEDTIEAVTKIKQCGIGVYNQQVFTYYNSKRFETAFLRKMLKLCGIDPYYSFNTKGKDETKEFMVPIARIQQERREEARLLPGMVRTDEPVFNIPELGKSHLRAGQDHEIIMIMPDGRRVFRFYPWEMKISLSDDYIYTDVGIYNYLKRLEEDGEKVEEYKTIWYYF